MKETIYLAGGCFWGCEKFFEQFDGILETECGYANGPTDHVTYEEVCRDSGHAECVRITFDPEMISLRKILDLYFLVIDPVSVNRQGHDCGIQYRTGIYYTDEEQRDTAREKLSEVERELGQRPAVELERLDVFCPAEEYHQKYLDKNPGGYCHIPSALINMNRPRNVNEHI